MNIKNNVSLKPYNTFGIEAKAQYFFEYTTENELFELIQSGFLSEKKFYNIGGGSNLLFTKDYDGLILHSRITDIEVIEENSDFVLVRVGAGMVWDDFVAYCVNHTWGGAENLSLIPGDVGACPVQNIGAYGVEAKDIIHSIEGIDLISKQKESISNTDCKFGYRESVFKHSRANQFIVTHVTYKLVKNPVFKLEYGAIQEELAKYSSINLKTIREVIIKIRESKLPDTKVLGNAGSFFKNPVVTRSLFEQLLKKYPQMPFYPASETEVKIPAGWLIEQCGWKGKKHGNAAVHDKQALVIVNLGDASGKEIVELSNLVQDSVKEKFNIDISPEVIFL